jgi:hypothetical protein
MDEPEDITLSEKIQTQKQKYCMLSLICRIQKISNIHRTKQWSSGISGDREV